MAIGNLGLKLKLKNLNLFFLFLVLLMYSLGIVLLYSVGESFNTWALKQFASFLVVLPILVVITFTNSSFFYRNAYLIYGIFLLLLIIAEVFGHKAMGAQRWIRFGPINFQPSELMKIGVILVLARYFHDMKITFIPRIHFLFAPVILTLLPVALILKQPNLGTSLIILAIAGSMFFVAGVMVWKFILLIAGAGFALPIIWSFLHDYQKQRVMTFLNPENDPLGTGYNIIQSLIAIGSGGLIGKGFNSGPQSQLNFLPEKHTDFIFTVLAEEFGFLGVFFTMFLTALIYSYGIALSWSQKNQFSRLLTFGVLTMFITHVVINTAMISGLMPVVGVPFPLLSYGGSNLISSLLGMALIASTITSKHLDLKNH
jgi:rod shape determining protein RodA